MTLRERWARTREDIGKVGSKTTRAARSLVPSRARMDGVSGVGTTGKTSTAARGRRAVCCVVLSISFGLSGHCGNDDRRSASCRYVFYRRPLASNLEGKLSDENHWRLFFCFRPFHLLVYHHSYPEQRASLLFDPIRHIRLGPGARGCVSSGERDPCATPYTTYPVRQDGSARCRCVFGGA